MEDMRECMAFEDEDWNEEATDLVMLWLTIDGWIAEIKHPLPYWIWFIRGWVKNKYIQIQLWWKIRQCMKWEKKHGNNNSRTR